MEDLTAPAGETHEVTEAPQEEAKEITSPEGEATTPKENVEKKDDTPLWAKKEFKKLRDEKRDSEKEAAYWKGQAEALKKNDVPAKEEVPQEKKRPTSEQFETHDEYVEALADFKIEERLSAQEKNKHSEQVKAEQEQVFKAHYERVEKKRASYADFDEVMKNAKSLPIGKELAEAIVSSEFSPEIVYFLGKNLMEATRISKLSPYLAAREIGKIEAKFTVSPTKKVSEAPKPIATIDGVGNAAAKSIDEMTTEERFALWDREERENKKRR